MDYWNHVNSQTNYFRDIFDLFDEFQWLVKSPVTQILINNSLKTIPQDWLEALRKLSYDELNEFVMGRLVRSDWPPTLVSFVERCKNLNRLSQISAGNQEKKTSSSLPFELNHGWSLKQQDEISRLVDFIHQKCVEENIRTIVDFGCELEVICQALNHLYGYRVRGLKCKNTTYANVYTRKLYPIREWREDFEYPCRTVNSNYDLDKEFVERTIKSLNDDENAKICLIGLHSCENLGLTSASAFHHIRQIQLLIMLSCCYHKLQFFERDEDIRFGMSSPLHQAIEEYNNKIKIKLNGYNENYVRNIFNRPFTRIAGQELAAGWEEWTDYDHEQHALCVLSRAVLELFACENDIVLKEGVRKATWKSQYTNFNTYFTDMLERCTLNNKNESKNEELADELKRMLKDHEEKLQDVEIFTALQLLLQGPAESLILEDRRFHVFESSECEDWNFETTITPVFDPKISPRSQVIVARVKQ